MKKLILIIMLALTLPVLSAQKDLWGVLLVVRKSDVQANPAMLLSIQTGLIKYQLGGPVTPENIETIMKRVYKNKFMFNNNTNQDVYLYWCPSLLAKGYGVESYNQTEQANLKASIGFTDKIETVLCQQPQMGTWLSEWNIQRKPIE